MLRSSMTLSKWLGYFKGGRPLYYLSDLCKLSGLSVSSMRRATGRLEKLGILKKAGKELYLNTLVPFSLERLSTVVYSPSYISNESALFFHGVLSQGPQVLTCVTTRSPRECETGIGTIFYQHVKSSLFFGYKKNEDYFMAEPEKAVLDLIYLSLQNGRLLSTDEWDWSAISKTKLVRMAGRFPQSVCKFIRMRE